MPEPYAPHICRSWPDYKMDEWLKPVDISMDLTTEAWQRKEAEALRHEVGPTEPDLYWFIMGLRVFNKPREVMIEEVVVDCRPMYRHRFDAAAFNLDMPPLPLRNDGKCYVGEPIRFVRQDLGCLALHCPIRFMLRPWEPGLAVSFDAIMIVHEERRHEYLGGPGGPGPWPASHASKGK